MPDQMGLAPRPITMRAQVPVPPGEAWALISTRGGLEEFHPFCRKNPVGAWPGVGSRDAVEYYNGRMIRRDFVGWSEGTGYDIEVSDTNGPLASVSWRLTEAAHGATLTISLTPRLLAGIPRLLRWLPSVTFVRPMLRRYLRSVLQGFEWRMRTGEPVERNQFGSHLWFSPRAI